MFEWIKNMYRKYVEKRKCKFRNRIAAASKEAIDISLADKDILWITYKGEPVIPVSIISKEYTIEDIVAKVEIIRDFYIERRMNGER